MHIACDGMSTILVHMCYFPFNLSTFHHQFDPNFAFYPQGFLHDACAVTPYTSHFSRTHATTHLPSPTPPTRRPMFFLINPSWYSIPRACVTSHSEVHMNGGLVSNNDTAHQATIGNENNQRKSNRLWTHTCKATNECSQQRAPFAITICHHSPNLRLSWHPDPKFSFNAVIVCTWRSVIWIVLHAQKHRVRVSTNSRRGDWKSM